MADPATIAAVAATLEGLFKAIGSGGGMSGKDRELARELLMRQLQQQQLQFNRLREERSGIRGEQLGFARGGLEEFRTGDPFPEQEQERFHQRNLRSSMADLQGLSGRSAGKFDFRGPQFQRGLGQALSQSAFQSRNQLGTLGLRLREDRRRRGRELQTGLFGGL